MVVFFYQTFGFYGFEHLFSIIFLHFSIVVLDDYIDKKQPFPWYVAPLLVVSAYFYPLVTFLAICGLLLVNLRALIKSDSFIHERIEGLGMIPIGLLPLILPLGITDVHAFIAPIFIILLIDSFHKISHRETKHDRLMWISGMIFLLVFTLIYVTTVFDLIILVIIAYIPLAGFRILQKKIKKYAFVYYQCWQGMVIIVFYAKYVKLLESGFQIN